MISREKMDKIVPAIQVAIVAVYLLVYIDSDVFHIKKTMKKAKKVMEK